MKTFDLVCQLLSDLQLVLQSFLTNPRILDHESGCFGTVQRWINSTVSLNIWTLILIDSLAHEFNDTISRVMSN